MRFVKSLVPALVVATFLSTLLSGISYAVTPDRIAGAVDATKLVQLKGHVAPMAQPQFDQGPADPSRKLHVTVMFLPTAQQDQTLNKLVDDLQDSASPNFHKWLTPAQYADQFGMSPRDMGKVSEWLTGQGFKVTYVANGRDFLSFEGSVAQVESAFQTEIHNYNVDGKMHFANATAPMIPAALSGIVGGFRGLHNFFPKSMVRKRSDFSTSATGGFFSTLAPGDIATIYGINPLYQAATPIDGTGQKVVIAGQSDVFLADLNYFRTAFGLPTISGCTTASDLITACNSTYFQLVFPNGVANDPGPVSGDLGESDLDIEWVSSVARKAQVIFVTSVNGVDDSAYWAIDNTLAPVISYSYGLCEAFMTSTGISTYELELKKGAALGISFFAASGDNAAATCDQPLGDYPVTLGPSVSYPASSAYVTGVGGTEFDESIGTGPYWNPPSSNGADGGSAIKYIPELAWNDTGVVGSPDGTGGGPSNCATGTGTTPVTVPGVGKVSFEVCKAPPNGGFPKPSWQVGVTPADSVRDVPDISFSASNANDAYIVCTPQDEVAKNSVTTSTCHTSITDALLTWNSAFGGTSAATPVAAGMAVLLNQYLATNGLGNMNPQIYKLHGATPSAFNNTLTGSSSTTSSDNIVQCTAGTPGSMTGFSTWPAALNCPSGGTLGYTVVAGYNLVTGLGSINMNTLFTSWDASRSASATTISPSATNVNLGASVTFTATVTATSTGTVSFSTLNNGTTTVLGTALINSPYPATATNTAVLTTTTLPGGTNNVTATFLGDASHKSSTSSAAVVTVIAPDFTMGSNPTSATVVAGHASNAITVTVTPVNGYNQATTLSCTGLPAGASCGFSPNPVTPNGTNAITSSMTVTTSPSMATGALPAFNVSASNGGAISHTSSFTLTVNSTDQSFTLAPQDANYAVTRPQSVNATLTLTPTNGFNTPVTYTCVDAVSETTCTGPTGATASTSPQFTITTTAPTRAMNSERSPRLFYSMLLPGLLGIVLTFSSRKRSMGSMRMLGLIMVLGVSTMWLGSCGGSSGGGTHDPGTPTGPQTVTINATTGGTNPLTATTTINFTVN